MRKRRTRQHFIEDLGFNYVEKQALLGRCTMQRITHDYGLDAEIHTYEENGEVEIGPIHLQIKSTDKMKLLKTRKEFAFDLAKSDLEFWLATHFPVIIILYDAKNDIGYFLYLRDYFQKNRILLREINKFIRVYISPDNKFDTDAVYKLRSIKNQIVNGKAGNI